MSYGIKVRNKNYTYGTLNVITHKEVPKEKDKTIEVISKADHESITEWVAFTVPTSVIDTSTKTERPVIEHTSDGIITATGSGSSVQFQCVVLGK